MIVNVVEGFVGCRVLDVWDLEIHLPRASVVSRKSQFSQTQNAGLQLAHQEQTDSQSITFEFTLLMYKVCTTWSHPIIAGFSYDCTTAT